MQPLRNRGLFCFCKYPFVLLTYHVVFGVQLCGGVAPYFFNTYQDFCIKLFCRFVKQIKPIKTCIKL